MWKTESSYVARRVEPSGFEHRIVCRYEFGNTLHQSRRPRCQGGFLFCTAISIREGVFVDDDAGDDGAADSAILASYDEADEEACLA